MFKVHVQYAVLEPPPLIHTSFSLISLKFMFDGLLGLFLQNGVLPPNSPPLVFTPDLYIRC